MGKGNKVEKLSDTVSGERAEQIKPLAQLHMRKPLFEMSDDYEHVPEYLFDDAFIEELEANQNEWADYPKVKCWRNYRNSLTKKDLSEMIE